MAADISRSADAEERRVPPLEDVMRDSALEQANISEALADRRSAERADLDPGDGAGRRRKDSLAREHRAVAEAARRVLSEAGSERPEEDGGEWPPPMDA